MHLVFVVKYRQAMIQQTWEDALYKYISGVIQKREQTLIAINGMSDHVHLLIGMRPSCCLSDLVREIKKASNYYITEYRLTDKRFEWQSGFAAFSHSRRELNSVIRYIANQKSHHRVLGFRDEYVSLLKEFNIEHKEQYLFDS
jgi:REP element-mobilizing transposase RayT